MIRSLRLAVLPVLLATSTFAGEPKWKKHEINPKSVFEAAGVFDVDKDGKLDVLSGDHWYKGPVSRPVIQSSRRVCGEHVPQLLHVGPNGRQRRRQDGLHHLLLLREKRRLGRESRRIGQVMDVSPDRFARQY